MGILESAYKKKFGPEVAERLCKDLRASTRKSFEGIWRKFQDFLRKEEVQRITAGTALNFLEYLFSVRKLSPKTVLCYRNAIAEPLRVTLQIEVSDRTFNRLARAQFLARPPNKKTVPNWDVNQVLQKLLQPDFRLETCSPDNLLAKTAFLVALATGNRASELCAVVRGWIIFRQYSEAILPVKPNFLFKNQRALRTPPNITIKGFAEVDPELCPLRALRIYLERTRELAEGDALFIHPTSGRNLQRPSLSLRLTAFISEVIPGSFPKMHDLRKQAASLAWTRGVEPKDIVAAAFWSSSNVFVKHYLFNPQALSMSCVALNHCAPQS